MVLSISKIKAFKACRKMYFFKYVEQLEPVSKSEALELGSNYHALLEQLNKTGALPECDYSKEYAMAKAYEKYIYPCFKVVEAEKWIEKELTPTDKLIGIVDGLADDGCIVEHKSYGGSESMEAYEYNLLWDEQILAYMFMTGKRKAHYTVCRKPTIRQRQNETAEEFYERMVAWYDEDTENKIKLIEVERTDEEVEQFDKNLYEILYTMKSSTNFYRNTCHCNTYGKRCEYSAICLNYDPKAEYMEFTRGE